LAGPSGQIGAGSAAAGFAPAAVTTPQVASLDCTFPTGRRAATDARHALREVFSNVVSAEALGDAELVLTELVANSVAASRIDAKVSVIVRQLIGSLLIEVADTCEHPPRCREASSWDEEGRGLHLVEQLCQSWGWHPEAQGKTVWALCPGVIRPQDERHNAESTSPPV
jgi:anti-sigma regulatory factor (Ser/Thr protein kinase)